ncbi:uncharacterized protein IWZ02DRAFT_170546 [Phyllosticta citriasiana]|uniref:Uncharacterized protein n=1 Tax=Phyllosticta citriasiana TaxID=595635 RepID=A0ABR1KJF2_9PEZI
MTTAPSTPNHRSIEQRLLVTICTPSITEHFESDVEAEDSVQETHSKSAGVQAPIIRQSSLKANRDELRPTFKADALPLVQNSPWQVRLQAHAVQISFAALHCVGKRKWAIITSPVPRHPILRRAHPGDLPGDWVPPSPPLRPQNPDKLSLQGSAGSQKGYPWCQNPIPGQVKFAEGFVEQAYLPKQALEISNSNLVPMTRTISE